MEFCTDERYSADLNTWLPMPMKWSPELLKTACLLEGNPHQLIEGMIVAAYAIQADISYVFLRWAYKKAARANQHKPLRKPMLPVIWVKIFWVLDLAWKCICIPAWADICVERKPPC